MKVRTQSWVLNIEPKEKFSCQSKQDVCINWWWIPFQKYILCSELVRGFPLDRIYFKLLTFLNSKIQSNTCIYFKAKKRQNLFAIMNMCWRHCFKIIFDLILPYWRARWTFIYFAWVRESLVIIIAWNNWQIYSCKVLKTCP